MNKNIVIILAGGVGSRFGLDIPKQFAKLAGKTIIEHTIDTFENHSLIDEICVVIKEDWKYKVEEFRVANKYKKVKKIISGGEERKDSSLSAINAYANDKDHNPNKLNLIFHDAVRPFVNNKIIDNIIEALSHYNAIDVAISATDTIIEVKDKIITHIPKRACMMQGQTPQAFKFNTIKKAYENAENDTNFKPTDDCGIVKKYMPEENIFVVEGSLENIKITHKQDIAMADKIFQSKSMKNNFIHNDTFYSEKLHNKVIVVFGGSYGIGLDICNLAEKYGASVISFSRTSTNTDVAILSDIQRDLQHTKDKFGKIDYIVNTASILVKEPIETMEYAKVLDTLNINYLGAINIARESVKYLSKTSGQLLNFTSSSYTRGRANYSLYSSSKAAIVNFTQALAEEFSIKDDIRVNCINPQRTLTPMRTSNFGTEDPKTLLTSEAVAYASINTLIADITGQIIDVKLDN
jgi:2-C-methyl-D-erythritol 4-phosphate cytidylyltransferase